MIFEVATDAEQADLFFTQMVELHHRRWQTAGRSGSFAPRHAEFHRTLARTLVPTGGVFLSRLSLDGQPFAVAYGHRVGHTYHCYQRGVNLQTQPVRSPGTAVLLLLMAHLVERDVTCYDHLMGVNSFKERYATEQHTFVRLRATRPTFRSFVSSLTDYARRGSRKILSLVRRSAKSTKP
jgi:CelD/BcsL family acetyltransferase involved in cellulose biosynthesis